MHMLVALGSVQKGNQKRWWLIVDLTGALTNSNKCTPNLAILWYFAHFEEKTQNHILNIEGPPFWEDLMGQQLVRGVVDTLTDCTLAEVKILKPPLHIHVSSPSYA